MEQSSKISILENQMIWQKDLKSDNPLANSDNYEVYLSDVSKQKDVVSYAKSLDGVRKVNKSDVVAKTLTSVNKLVGYVSVAIIAILSGSVHFPDQ